MNPFTLIGSAVLFPLRFGKEVVEELRKVTWPSRRDTARSTALVIAISIGVGLYIAALDLGFTKGFELLLSLKK